MAAFKFTPQEDYNEDRVYTPVEDAFDLSTLRVEEGLAINVYDSDRIDFPGRFVLDASFLTCHREE